MKERRLKLVDTPILVSLILIVLLCILPTGYEDAVIYKGMDRCAAEVVNTDESMIVDTGLIRSGEQVCEIKLLGGKFKGSIVKGYNMLSGSLESDKLFAVGDRALVVISHQDDQILSVNMIDHYRINREMILVGVFIIFLIAFSGKGGFKAIVSFLLTVLMIWKVLVPSYLNGMNPIVIGLGTVLILAFMIIALVYGFDQRALAATSGAFLGVVVTAILGCLFTNAFKIHGATMESSESLLYSGYASLNLTQIFMASIFIGASGAVMDLAVDITSAVYEVVQKKPEISWQEAMQSGINVGRAAVGTMTTTLLLAYSGGYMTLLMVFMAQGTPIYNILNYKYVSAEILQTIVGSIGLVTVAPFTALTSGIFLTREGMTKHKGLVKYYLQKITSSYKGI